MTQKESLEAAIESLNKLLPACYNFKKELVMSLDLFSRAENGKIGLTATQRSVIISHCNELNFIMEDIYNTFA
ncbi:unnamed protein product [marine sediment metagenome]|uniref:Uncharacterized protein n=1 Tax=marine sediment metagenome TaxID=412755 RepID=X0T3C9_9ZZZZ